MVRRGKITGEEKCPNHLIAERWRVEERSKPKKVLGKESVHFKAVEKKQDSTNQFNQDGVEDDSDSASRGNWWQGLKQCGKTCKLRWLNYFRPDIKRGLIAPVITTGLGALAHTLGTLVPRIGASAFAAAATAIGIVASSFR